MARKRICFIAWVCGFRLNFWIKIDPRAISEVSSLRLISCTGMYNFRFGDFIQTEARIRRWMGKDFVCHNSLSGIILFSRTKDEFAFTVVYFPCAWRLATHRL